MNYSATQLKLFIPGLLSGIFLQVYAVLTTDVSKHCKSENTGD